jgi:galactose mutarotase-like enzyme
MLLPYANRIAGGKYTFNGTEYQLPINDVAGLNNSLHGLLWNKTMKVCSSDFSHTNGHV